MYGHENGNGFRESEGGRGAWGGFRGGDGKWEAYDTGEFNVNPGTGEERYMSNLQFLGLIAGLVSPSHLYPVHHPQDKHRIVSVSKIDQYNADKI